MNYSEKQMLIFLARAQRAHAEIVSGAYRLRKIFHGPVTSNGPELTDDEKLAMKVAEMDRHIHFAQECADYDASKEARLDGLRVKGVR